jgi:EamA-like transporter family
VPLPESAVLDPVAAGGHVAPGACPAVGAVVEGPPAVRVAAGLEPLPGATALGVADHQQQGEQARARRAGGVGAEADLPAGPDVHRGPGGLRNGLQGLQVGGSLLLAAAGTGMIDVVANICYVAATRTGMFGLAVALTSLYPGVTVLLARVVLGERLRWVQRAGLGLAAIGILLVAT